MDNSILSRVRSANTRLRSLLQVTRDALAGRRNFGVDDMRAIAEPLSEVSPLIAEAKRLRTVQPELDVELEAYARILRATQTALEQMRFALLAQRAHMESLRSHTETIRLWATTLRQTVAMHGPRQVPGLSESE